MVTAVPTSLGDPTVQQELVLVAVDGNTLLELATELPSLPGRSILGSLLVPMLSFYVVEVADWLRARSSSHPDVLGTYSPGLRSARARLKLFDDNKLRLVGLADLMSACDRDGVAHFNRAHRGLLGPLKRWLQDDLGLYFIGPDLVQTSHVMQAVGTLASIGPTSTTRPLGELIREGTPAHAVRLGEIIGSVARASRSIAEAHPLRGTRAGTLETLRRQDVKSSHLYVAAGKTLGVEAADVRPLTALIGQVNFVHRWLRCLLPEDSPLLLRVRYLTAYAALRALGQLNGRARRQNPTAELGVLCAQLLGSEPARLLRLQPKALRNMLAHYRLRQAADGLTWPEGRVEALATTSFGAVDGAVDAFLEETSLALRGVVPLSRRAVPLDE